RFLSCCVQKSSCCKTENAAESLSKKIGYTEEELAAAPGGANLGLGCGNPVALASIKEGEIIVDLGSGPGLDCFLAAGKAGKNGKVIGIDMTPDMIERARENAKKGRIENVEFRLGDIEKIPVEDNTADAIISNCVINLAPDKRKVFGEAFRVLKPGGRIMVSDMVSLKELPGFIKDSIDAYIGCLGGAMIKDEYLDAIKSAGFVDVRIVNESYLPVEYKHLVDDPAVKTIIKNLKLSPENIKAITESFVSIKVHAVKP
ncbi:MAG: arsenite methyltransferase, partial [Firmicutes bacterium]|nr:arsenite methyltransferase [Bacillota bacterium]